MMKTEDAVSEEMTDEELAAEQAALDAEDGGGDVEPAERKTLADLAAETPDEEPEVEQYTLFGTAPQVNSTVKGTKSISSTVKFKAKQQVLPGQFQVDDLVELRVLARVDGLTFSTKRDGDGDIVSTSRVHAMTLIKLEQMGEVDAKFLAVDGREDPAEELSRLRARIAELEGELG